MSYTYSTDALVAAHTAFRDLLDAETGSATVEITDDADTVLGTITLADPSGTVSGTTGQLTFSDDGGTYSASASGEAANASLKDGAGAAHLTLPVVQGEEAVAGYCVLSSTSLTSGDPLVLSGLVIG